MNREQDFEVIKSRTLVLKSGEPSSEVILTDPQGGDMYFTFRLDYIHDSGSGDTRLTATDSHHALVEIQTRPNAITKPSEYLELGTYGNGKPLYLGFVVQPQIAQSGEHNVIITFYTRKEVDNGSEGR